MPIRQIVPLLVLCSFVAGYTVARSVPDWSTRVSAETTSAAYVPFAQQMPTDTPAPTLAPPVPPKANSFVPQSGGTQPHGKFTITESRAVTASQSHAEIGQQIDFSLALKNIGTAKKFLTHICMQESGGATFGCIMNKNLYPGEEFGFSAGMTFPKPGTYSVWVTWSQDGTSFFRPLNAHSATVTIE